MCDVTGLGGAVTYLAYLARTARSAGWEPHFLLDSAAEAQSVADYLGAHRVVALRAPIKRNNAGDDVAAAAYYAIVQRARPTLVHAVLGSPRSALVPREVTIRLGLPLVVTECYVSPAVEIAPDTLERVRRVQAAAAAVIFVSQDNRQVSREHFGVCPRRSLVIPNSVSVVDASPCRPISRRQVLTVARLSTQKGIDVLVDAVALLADHKAVVSVAGEGELRSALERRAAERAPGRIRFLGWRDDVAALLRTADLFVLPSRSEGQPYALLEAMAAHVPCIASAVSGIPEALDFGRAGTLVLPDDPPALAQAMDDFFHDPAPYRAKADMAITHLRQQFDEELNTATLLRVWQDCR